MDDEFLQSLHEYQLDALIGRYFPSLVSEWGVRYVSPELNEDGSQTTCSFFPSPIDNPWSRTVAELKAGDFRNGAFAAPAMSFVLHSEQWERLLEHLHEEGSGIKIESHFGGWLVSFPNDSWSTYSDPIGKAICIAAIKRQAGIEHNKCTNN